MVEVKEEQLGGGQERTRMDSFSTHHAKTPKKSSDKPKNAPMSADSKTFQSPTQGFNDVINSLSLQRQQLQEKTFTKWLNAVLKVRNQKIDNLYTDLQDGRVLISLLEILSGENLSKPNLSGTRIHFMENNLIALNFLKENNIKISNIGPDDIVNGKKALTLGLIWTIILRFQIQRVLLKSIDKDDTVLDYSHATSEAANASTVQNNQQAQSLAAAKGSLLLWCQMKTVNYTEIDIRDFTSSWVNGLAFNALIHCFLPHLINFQSLTKDNPKANLENAFSVAEKELDIPRIIDIDDISSSLYPDEKSIIMYVSMLYSKLNKLNEVNSNYRKLQNFTQGLIAYEGLNGRLKNQFESIQDNLEQNKMFLERITKELYEKEITTDILDSLENQLQDYSNAKSIATLEIYNSMLFEYSRAQVLNFKLSQTIQISPVSVNSEKVKVLENLFEDCHSAEKKALEVMCAVRAANQEREARQTFTFKQIEVLEDWISDMGSNLNNILMPGSKDATFVSGEELKSYISTHKYLPFELSAASKQIRNLDEKISTQIDREKPSKITQAIEKLKSSLTNVKNLYDSIYERFNETVPLVKLLNLLLKFNEAHTQLTTQTKNLSNLLENKENLFVGSLKEQTKENLTMSKTASKIEDEIAYLSQNIKDCEPEIQKFAVAIPISTNNNEVSKLAKSVLELRDNLTHKLTSEKSSLDALKNQINVQRQTLTKSNALKEEENDVERLYTILSYVEPIQSSSTRNLSTNRSSILIPDKIQGQTDFKMHTKFFETFQLENDLELNDETDKIKNRLRDIENLLEIELTYEDYVKNVETSSKQAHSLFENLNDKKKIQNSSSIRLYELKKKYDQIKESYDSKSINLTGSKSLERTVAQLKLPDTSQCNKALKNSETLLRNIDSQIEKNKTDVENKRRNTLVEQNLEPIEDLINKIKNNRQNSTPSIFYNPSHPDSTLKTANLLVEHLNSLLTEIQSENVTSTQRSQSYATRSEIVDSKNSSSKTTDESRGRLLSRVCDLSHKISLIDENTNMIAINDEFKDQYISNCKIINDSKAAIKDLKTKIQSQSFRESLIVCQPVVLSIKDSLTTIKNNINDLNIGDVDLSQDDLARKIQKLADDRAEVVDLIENLQIEIDRSEKEAVEHKNKISALQQLTEVENFIAGIFEKSQHLKTFQIQIYSTNVDTFCTSEIVAVNNNLLKSKNCITDELCAAQTKIKTVRDRISSENSKPDNQKTLMDSVSKNLSNKFNSVESSCKNIALNMNQVQNDISNGSELIWFSEKIDLVSNILKSITDSLETNTPTCSHELILARICLLKQLKQDLHLTSNRFLCFVNDCGYHNSLTDSNNFKPDPDNNQTNVFNIMQQKIFVCQQNLNVLLNEYESRNQYEISFKPVSKFTEKIASYECMFDQRVLKPSGENTSLLIPNEMFLKEVNIKLKSLKEQGERVYHNRPQFSELINAHLLKIQSVSERIISLLVEKPGLSEADNLEGLEISEIYQIMFTLESVIVSIEQLEGIQPNDLTLVDFVKNILLAENFKALSAAESFLASNKNKESEIKTSKVNDLIELQNKSSAILNAFAENLDSHQAYLGEQLEHELRTLTQSQVKSRCAFLKDKIMVEVTKQNDFNSSLYDEITCSFANLIDYKSVTQYAITEKTVFKSISSMKHQLETLLTHLKSLLTKMNKDCRTLSTSSKDHIMPKCFETLDGYKLLYEWFCNFFESLKLSNQNLEYHPIILKDFDEIFEKFGDFFSKLDEFKTSHKCVIESGNLVNKINWVLKIRNDLVRKTEFLPDNDARNIRWIDCLDFLSANTTSKYAKILSKLSEFIQSQLENSTVFASTLTIWHKDVNESWNTLFDLINSEKYRLDAQHLTNKTMSENQYLLAQISVLENYMEHYIQKHHENPITGYPDIRIDIANLEPLVHKCIEDSRRLYNQSDMTSTNALKEIAIRLASRYQYLYERSRQLHVSINQDKDWNTFQYLDRKLRKKLTALMHSISKLSFDRNHDEQIWIALNQHSLIKAEADSLAEVFEFYVQLARSMVVDDNANSSQIKTLVLSLTSRRADLMQLIEDSSSVLRSSVQSTIAAHDQQVKQMSLQIAEEQLEYLCSLCRLLASQTNLSLVRDQLKSLDLRVGDSLDRLNEIHSSHDDISAKSFSNLNKNMQKGRKNVRDEYIVDLSSLKSDRFIKSKPKAQKSESNRLSFATLKNILTGGQKQTSHQHQSFNSPRVQEISQAMRHWKNAEFSHKVLDQFEGKLYQKIVQISPNVVSANLSPSAKRILAKKAWDTVYCILSFGLMLVYNESNHASSDPMHPLFAWDLTDCICSNASVDYKNKPNFFKLNSKDNLFEVHFQTRTSTECSTWIHMIQNQSTSPPVLDKSSSPKAIVDESPKKSSVDLSKVVTSPSGQNIPIVVNLNTEKSFNNIEVKNEESSTSNVHDNTTTNSLPTK